MLRVLKVTLFALLIASVLTTTFGAGYALAVTSSAPASLAFVEPAGGGRALSRGAPRQFQLLDEVWTVLKQDFVDPDALDPNKLGRGALDGMIAALGDAHTSYIDAGTFSSEQSGIRGSYEGIGAHVSLDDGVLTIVAPIAGSPAEEAGIRAGDRIVAVNGEPTHGMSLNDAVEKIKGPRGSKVTLSVIHKGETIPQTLEIARAEIKTNSVLLQMLPEGFARIRIVQFTQRTSSELIEALRDAKNQKAKGVVLDLRNNPGGLLDATVEATNQFLDGGIAGYQVDRQGHKQELRLTGNRDANALPAVVLVNGGSASGSELLAGALQDRGRAVLIGTKTFGKGSVNHLRQLSDGSALYVTIGRWFTPQGRQIEGNGLTPDIPVELSQEDIRNQHDIQLERAVQVLQTRSG